MLKLGHILKVFDVKLVAWVRVRTLADDDLPVEMVCPAEGLRGIALDSFPDTQNQEDANCIMYFASLTQQSVYTTNDSARFKPLERSASKKTAARETLSSCFCIGSSRVLILNDVELNLHVEICICSGLWISKLIFIFQCINFHVLNELNCLR